MHISLVQHGTNEGVLFYLINCALKKIRFTYFPSDSPDSRWSYLLTEDLKMKRVASVSTQGTGLINGTEE